MAWLLSRNSRQTFYSYGEKQQRSVGGIKIWELSHEFSNINLKLQFTESVGHISIIHLDNMGDFVLSHIFAQEGLWTKLHLEYLFGLF